MPKLTSIALLLALNSSAWATASATSPTAAVSPPTKATTPLPAAAGALAVAEPASQGSKGLDLSAATPEAMPSPYFKRWPFWTAVGVAVGAAVVVGAGFLARSNNDATLSNPTFGTKDY